MVAVAAAFTLGTALDARPMTIGESAVSAVLIVGLHRVGSAFAYNRLIDALIGGGLAIVTAQLLFPIDPIDLVRKESQRLRSDLADRNAGAPMDPGAPAGLRGHRGGRGASVSSATTSSMPP